MHLKYIAYITLPVLLFLSISSCQHNSNSISFNEHVRPILNEHCVSCHGGVKKQGDLNLLFEHTAKAQAKSGKIAIVPNNLDASELYKRIIHSDPEIRMPLDGPALTNQEISILADWIRDGAQWEKHWAYELPLMPDIPDLANWGSNEIDALVLAKLDSLDLHPNEIASPEILLGRISQDLIGLPPTDEERKIFLEKKNFDPEELINHYLASPHFGERWASLWLDLARYADSHGYEKDHHREIWKYRDWVIQSFNEDKPFDEFTIEQLAGDLLHQPTTDQLIATGFHRNTMVNSEGGVRNEEYRIAGVMDRVNTTWEVWSSTSMACAQCHGHPYDPFTHEEYYEQLAYFNNTRDEDIGDDSPNLFFYDELQQSNIDSIKNWITNYSSIKNATEIEKLLRITEPKIWSYGAEVISKTATVGDDYILQGRDGGIAVFKDFPFYKVSHFLVSCSSAADDSHINLYTDSLLQNLIGVWQLGKPGSKLEIFKLSQIEGRGNLYLQFVSASANQRDNDGVGTIFWILPNDALAVFDNVESTDEKETFINLLANPKEKTPILVENEDAFQRKTFVFDRGSWLSPTTAVDRGIPKSLPNQLDQAEEGRLALAKWLVNGEHPLTSRVFVNRIWEQLFGAGLVTTLEDFGTQGELPSHPKLLDYLATDFQSDMKWSLKSLLKKIMLSATYLQSSKASPDKLEKDPYNVFLARGPRFRMTAEQIRDKALAIGELLNAKVGGPSVMPYLPPAAWNPVYPQYTRVHWKTSQGDDKYRRALYTYAKRTNPYPSNSTFDMQSRDICVSRRIRTNTPLQALNMLNDPVYLEAANALGDVMNEVSKNSSIKGAIEFGFKKALIKNPDVETIALLLDLYEESNEFVYNNNQEILQEPDYLSMGLNSPMAVIANAIMNLDAFVVKQ